MPDGQVSHISVAFMSLLRGNFDFVLPCTADHAGCLSRSAARLQSRFEEPVEAWLVMISEMGVSIQIPHARCIARRFRTHTPTARERRGCQPQDMRQLAKSLRRSRGWMRVRNSHDIDSAI